VREKIALILVHMAEGLTGIRVVQAFTREPLSQAQFEDVNSQHLRANAETVRLMSVYGPSVELLGQLDVVLILFVGGLRAFHGDISVGTLAAFLLLVRMFFDPLQDLSQFFNSWQAATAGLEKIAGVLRVTSDVPESHDAQPLPARRSGGEGGVAVRFDQVTFSYGREPVLHNVDLSIAAGETLALVGATGAGKSTIAKLVARFYDPTVGRVLLDGHDLRHVTSDSMRSAVAVVPQEAFLFSGTIHDNIALGRPGVTRADVELAAVAVGADGFIGALPDRYDTDVDRRGARLSGGQRQLISFARAWIGDPRVLILDEATSALDLRTERLLQQALAGLLADRTAIVIAHRLSSLEVADRVAVVEQGRIVELGTRLELLALGGRFALLHERWQASTTGGGPSPSPVSRQELGTPWSNMQGEKTVQKGEHRL
jgi:ABC-type multidrug transport system fused ATPase/permease subunit